MSTTHVFIVDKTTFKLHLEYQFVGTGSGDDQIDFNNCATSTLHHTKERNLVRMMADSQRIRVGDFVIFYLQQDYRENIFEGKFFGIFKIKEAPSFLDNYSPQQYLINQLNKSLTFRAIIEPHLVYENGVTEWEALDEIKSIQSPNQMLWSLIYRKLKGNRGNTMITIYESERLFDLLRKKNNRATLNTSDFSFDSQNQKITSNTHALHYSGNKEKINILPRLLSRYKNGNAFEEHLQCYITQVIGEGLNQDLDSCLIGNNDIEWLGNEVSCGVGMQRIDILLSLIGKQTNRVCCAIELKDEEVDIGIFNQLQRYVDWISQYYHPNHPSDIQPVIISKEFRDKNSQIYKNFNVGINSFNNINTSICPIIYIEFSINNGNLLFKKIF